MSETSESVTVPHEKLREVAKYQRWVILSLLLNIAAMILFFVLGPRIDQLPSGNIILRSVMLANVAFQVASIVMLARQFSNVFVAFLVALAMFVPLVSLLVLLIYSQKATAFLQKNGIRVGFFGVSPNSI
jgi:uncharacterized protein involved in cysteine biosynthesis